MSGMCIQVLIKLGFGKNYPSDIMGRIKCSYGWDGCKGRGWGGGAVGIHGVNVAVDWDH